VFSLWKKKSVYTIWIVSPDNYVHSRCFEEIALCLQQALQKMGHPCSITTKEAFENTNTVIVLGGHLISQDWNAPQDRYFIFYNLEQPERFKEHYIRLLQRHLVWDYSAFNIATLEKLGIKAKHCEIGYMPALTRIKNLPPDKQDIDVLFYGSLNERRQKIIDNLLRFRINVVPLFGVYGLERDAFIARSKIILNMHFYESKLFEIVRCSYLMANKKCIVSESGSDPHLESDYYDAIAFADYDNLVAEIIRLLDNGAARGAYGKKAFDVFTRKSQTRILKHIL
jgi:hypothetical protein